MATKKRLPPPAAPAPASAAAPTAPVQQQLASKGPTDAAKAVVPTMHNETEETQAFGQIVRMPNGLDEAVCRKSVEVLNQTLADTITLRDMYKKHHWQVVGPTFDQLHLMYDKHFEAQAELVDLIAERIQVLGGISVAMAHDVAELTNIERLPKGREKASVQLTRLISAHELIIKAARENAEKAQDNGDSGTNDLLVSDVLRTNELQVWFVSEHLVAASPA